MTLRQTSRLTFALVLATGGALALAGCSAIQDGFAQEVTTEFPDAAAARSQWDVTVPWLPDDATAIVTKKKPEGDVASVLVNSSSALDPATCAEVDRESAPTVNVPDAPDVYAETRVFACGQWSVAATDEGWYGWTPNSPGEKTQATP